MFQSVRLLRALWGVHRFFPTKDKVQPGVALQRTGMDSTSFEQEGRTGLDHDEGAIHRLLSRAELELSKPEAVRRRGTIELLKLAAAEAGQSTSSQCPARPPAP
jgi:hypothetical protein